MKINLGEITEKLESLGLVSVRAAFLEAPKFQILVSGDLDYFLKSVKNLGETAVFITDYPFGESYFTHEAEFKILGDYGDDLTSENKVSLSALKPELESYKQYIDEIPFLRLSAFYREKILTYYHNAEWYSQFEKLEGEAVEIFEANEQTLKTQAEANQAALAEEGQKQEAILIENLKTLLSDKKFARLGTQRAMQSYALEVMPKLESLSPFILKNEIQLLSDRLKAEKLLDD